MKNIVKFKKTATALANTGIRPENKVFIKRWQDGAAERANGKYGKYAECGKAGPPQEAY